MSAFGWSTGLGLSAQAIAYRGSKDHPHDPADLLRCINYCKGAGINTERLRERMAGRSVQWDRLLPHWDDLAALLQDEIAERTDGSAPLTYMEMKRIINAGHRCIACAGSGRGEECLKCKGSGRRSGGKCRAEKCYEGAAYCSRCRGRGYTADAASAA